jgi:hypothetical protein
LDLIGAIIGMSAVGVNLVAFTHALPGTPARRLGLAAIGGAWVGLASGLGAAGKLAFSPANPVPLIGVLFALPLLVVGMVALGSQRVRAALLAVPTPLLIGLNSLRVLRSGASVKWSGTPACCSSSDIAGGGRRR